MKLLILGGTVFLGRHIVDEALERDHEVTLFNRGRHNPELYPEVEKLRGDRDGDLDGLAGRRWDVVIDTCGYVPRIVEQSVALLRDSVEHYTFISSLSAYADFAQPYMDEDAPVARMEDESVEEVTGETYGPLKVLCEETTRAGMPDGSLIVRPGLIVGPHDPTDRFTYWPVRVNRGGEVLAPQGPDVPVEFSDVRDLAAWTLTMAEKRVTGTFNVSGPEKAATLGSLLARCQDMSDEQSTITWVDAQFLQEMEVNPWGDMPLWVGDDPSTAGFARFDTSRARAEGLRLRPVSETVTDTLEWALSRPADHEWRAGLTPERESELLNAWHERQS